METESKSKYIEAWNRHINNLTILAFCKDDNLSKRIIEIRDELLNIVPKVADVKSFEED